MKWIKIVTKVLCGAFYIGAGVMHFVRPDFYVKIMPPYIPLHVELVYLSGVIEIALGALLLVPRYSRWAALGIIALLIAVFPANIHVYQNQHLVGGESPLHLVRLFVQGLLILWAYWYTRPEESTR